MGDISGQDRFFPQLIIVNQGDTVNLTFKSNDIDGAHTFTVNTPTGTLIEYYFDYMLRGLLIYFGPKSVPHCSHKTYIPHSRYSMLKVETLAIALCVFMLAGLAMYALDILNIPGAKHLIQQANAIRSAHQCSLPVYGC
jgi:hypothetical protein